MKNGRKMSKKPATKAEKAHMDAVAALGCIACRNTYGRYNPATIHHVRHDGQGGNSRRDHLKTIGLCPKHHQFHGKGVSIHDGLKSFEAIHGREQDLLQQVEELLS